MDNYLTDEDLAPKLGITVKTLRNKISSGQPVPPYYQPAGYKIRYYLLSEVEAWIRGQKVNCGLTGSAGRVRR